MTITPVSIGNRILRSRALAALTSPHGVDRYLEQVNPMWAAHEVRARVVAVHRETDGAHPVATLTLQPTTTWRGHRAGQYLQVGVEIDGARRTTRCFSISSAASAPGEAFTITVRAHDDAPTRRSVSRFLVRDARPGQVLHLGQAQGEFTLAGSPATPSNEPLLMISGGSGITPVMSMVRTLLRDGYDGRANRPVTFLHYARNAQETIYAEELAEIAADDNDVDVHLVHTDKGGAKFSAQALAELVPGFTGVDSWVCGPAGLVDLVRSAYGDSPRLRLELFKAPVVGAGTAEGQVAFTRSGLTRPNTGSSLLEQAEAAGLTPVFGCRMGICFSCTSTKTDGTVRNVLTGEQSSLPDEEIRICVSAPVGPCSVDL